jgi:hypothetical protein
MHALSVQGPGPIPDPEAFARAATTDELLAYKREFGVDSREWALARQELSRRSWHRKLYPFLAMAWVAWMAFLLFR